MPVVLIRPIKNKTRSCLRALRSSLHHLFVALIAAAIAFHIGASSAQAEDWPRLPNGDVVITVKGVRLALPGKDSDAMRYITFFFSQYATDQKIEGFDLPWAIANPDIARARFEAARNVMLTMSAGYPGNEPFVGKFDKSEFRNFKARVSITGEPNCRRLLDGDRGPSMLRQDIEAGVAIPDADGWAMKGFDQSSADGSYASRLFMHKEARGLFKTFSCGGFRSCGATTCLADNINASIKFDETTTPRRAWTRLDEFARTLFRSVLIDLKF